MITSLSRTDNFGGCPLFKCSDMYVSFFMQGYRTGLLSMLYNILILFFKGTDFVNKKIKEIMINEKN